LSRMATAYLAAKEHEQACCSSASDASELLADYLATIG